MSSPSARPGPWRAPDHLGMRAGLREFADQVGRGTAGRRGAALAVAGVGSKVAAMTARGAVLRPRLAAAGGVPLVGRGVRVRGAHQVRVGARLRVEDYAEIQGTSLEGVVLGDGVTVGAFAAIRPTNYYGRSLGVGLRVGDRTSIGPSCYIGCLGGVTIGSDVMLAPGVMVFAESHNFDDDAETIKSQGLDFRPVVIEDDCWIASRVVVTGGVTIGRGSVVGAASVVTKDVPPGSIAVGNPARVVRARRRGEATGSALADTGRADA